MREIDRADISDFSPKYPIERQYNGTVLHGVSEADDITNYVGALSEADSPLGGEVELDESYFGPRRVRGKRGRGADHKTFRLYLTFFCAR